MTYYEPDAFVSIRSPAELVVSFVYQTQSFQTNPRHQRPINGYLVALESFWIIDGGDIRAGERTVRRIV